MRGTKCTHHCKLYIYYVLMMYDSVGFLIKSGKYFKAEYENNGLHYCKPLFYLASPTRFELVSPP